MDTAKQTAEHAHEATTREAQEQRAMAHAKEWTPSIDRRQSFSKEDQKRALQMSGIADKSIADEHGEFAK